MIYIAYLLDFAGRWVIAIIGCKGKKIYVLKLAWFILITFADTLVIYNCGSGKLPVYRNMLKSLFAGE
jgi:hypothetical protein